MKKTKVNNKNKGLRKSIKRKQKGGARQIPFREALNNFLVGPEIPDDRIINRIHNYIYEKNNEYNQVLSLLDRASAEELIDGFIEVKIVMLTPGSQGLSAADIQDNRVSGRKQQIIDLGNDIGEYLINKRNISSIYIRDENILAM